MPVGKDKFSTDWNLWLNAGPSKKMHILSQYLHFLWLAVVCSWNHPRNASTDKMNYYPHFDWTVSSSTIGFFQKPTMGSHCNSLRNIKNTRLIHVSSNIYSLWTNDLGALLSFAINDPCDQGSLWFKTVLLCFS